MINSALRGYEKMPNSLHSLMHVNCPHKRSFPSHTQLPADLVVGVDSVDEDHRMLIAQLECLKGHAGDLTLNSEVMGECAYVIGKALLAHFEHEDAILGASDTPAAALTRHREEHEKIIAEYVELQERMMTRPSIKVVDVIEELENWIIQHVKSYDVPDFRVGK